MYEYYYIIERVYFIYRLFVLFIVILAAFIYSIMEA